MTATMAFHGKAGEASLIRLKRLRGDKRYRYALTPLGNSASAYHRPFQITKITNPALFERLDQRIRTGKASFTVRANGHSYPVKAQRLTAHTFQYNWGNEATLIFSEDEEEPQTYASAELAIVVIAFIVVVTAGVALAVISDDDTAEVEADAGDPSGGEGDGGDNGGDGDGSQGD